MKNQNNVPKGKNKAQQSWNAVRLEIILRGLTTTTTHFT